MREIDDHVTDLQKEMIDITNNLKQFRNKNHKTISLLINNLNILSNEIINHQFDNDDSNTNFSNKQSNYDEQKSSIDLNYEEQKINQTISQKKYENKNRHINRNRNNSIFLEKYKDNYKTFFNHNNNNSHKKNDYIAHSMYLRMVQKNQNKLFTQPPICVCECVCVCVFYKYSMCVCMYCTISFLKAKATRIT